MVNKVDEFQKKYPTKAEKEKALRAMSNKEIDSLIADSTNIQGKIWYKSFKKKG
jgi:hypothetical protein